MILHWYFYWLKFCIRYKVFPLVLYVDGRKGEIWSRYYMKWIRHRNRIKNY